MIKEYKVLQLICFQGLATKEGLPLSFQDQDVPRQ